jgi:hypothetical protein
VIEATSKTPDPNASNNFAATGLLVAQVTPVVRRLRKGQQAGFTVHAIASARTAGRTLRLRATANAPAARLAVASDRIAVIAQSFAGTGRG